MVGEGLIITRHTHTRDVHGGAATAAPHPRWRQRQFIFHYRRGPAQQWQLPKNENLKNS